jgi:DNA-directed RNA polymerase specialized sigma24 family protein
MLRHWHRVEGDPEGHLRRTIYHLAADGWRRQRRWRERLPLLGCSPGTVKSAASRGLARLRELGGTPPAAPACQEGTMRR